MGLHIPVRAARGSLSRRVFATITTISIASIMAFALGTSAYVQSRLTELAHTEIANQIDIVAAALEGTPDDRMMIKRFDELRDTRATLIDTDGTVLYDSEEAAEDMPNHADRPEVAQAFATGRGTAERPSQTLGEVQLYEAVRLDNGMVVRLSQTQHSLLSVVSTLIVPLLVLAALCTVVAFFAARRESMAIIEPLTEVDLDHPVRNVAGAYEEMVPMLERIESQRQELKRQVRVLADNDRMRREFTANVTHELKTPLTTISGYAELIGSGMVADEDDVRDFARRIHREAGRLTALVNDILTLSTLDEVERDTGEAADQLLGAREPIDVPRLLEGIAQRLETVAASADVAIKLDTVSAVVVGVPRLIDELVYNLASNAIRYNKPEGTVTLSCGMEGVHPFLRVADTGIGIAQEEQGKVFERFYRVDKSRSKARGGTGLGLAIVKHAAMLHNATIELKSELGEGTCITVRFPEQDLSQTGLQ